MESVIIWDCSSYALQTSVIRPENSSAILLTLSLPQVTKTEFLLTISIQYQAGR